MSETEKFPASMYSPAERRLAESMVDIEREALAEAEECEYKEGMFTGLTRRGLLMGGVALGGNALAGSRARADALPGAIEYYQPDSTKEQGRLILNDDGYGSRASSKRSARCGHPLIGWMRPGPFLRSGSISRDGPVLLRRGRP